MLVIPRLSQSRVPTQMCHGAGRDITGITCMYQADARMKARQLLLIFDSTYVFSDHLHAMSIYLGLRSIIIAPTAIEYQRHAYHDIESMDFPAAGSDSNKGC